MSVMMARQSLGAFAELLKAIISFVMYVCLFAWNNLAPPPPGRIFMKFNVRICLKKSVEIIQVSLKSNKNNLYFT